MLEPAKKQLKEARELGNDFGLEVKTWYEFSDKELARLVAHVSAKAHNAALDSAEKVLTSVNSYDNPMTASDCADKIRTMKEPT